MFYSDAIRNFFISMILLHLEVNCVPLTNGTTDSTKASPQIQSGTHSASDAIDLCATRAESVLHNTSELQDSSTKFNRIDYKVTVNATVRLECHVCFDKESVYTRVWFKRQLKYVEDLRYGFYAEQLDDEMKPIDAAYVVPGAPAVSADKDVLEENAGEGATAAAPKPKFQIEFGTHDLLINSFSLDDQGEYHCRTHEYHDREPDFIYFVTASLDFKPKQVRTSEIKYALPELIFPGEDGVNAWLVTPKSRQKYRVTLGKLNRMNSDVTVTHAAYQEAKGWSDCSRCDAWGMKTRQWQCRITLPHSLDLMLVHDRRFVSACQFQFEGLERGVWPLPLLHHQSGADLEDRRWVLRACFEAQRQIFPQFETIVADDLELYADRMRGVHNPNSTRFVIRQFDGAHTQGVACNDGRRYAVMQKLTNGMFPARADLAGWVETQPCKIACSSLPGGGAELKSKFELEANVDLQHIKEFENGAGDQERKVNKMHLRYFAGEQVSLLCPNTSYDRMVVWMNETRPLSPFTLTSETQNRVEIDAVSRLIIHAVEEADEAVYSCWQNEVLFAKLTLQVDDRSDVVIPDFGLAVWYLNIAMFFNCTMFLSLLIVMCKRYKSLVAFSTQTYGGEDVERIKDDEVDSGTASSDSKQA